MTNTSYIVFRSVCQMSSEIYKISLDEELN